MLGFVGVGLLFLTNNSLLETQHQAENPPKTPEDQPKIGWDSTTSYSSVPSYCFNDLNFDTISSFYGTSAGAALADFGGFMRVTGSGAESFWTLADINPYWPIFVHDVYLSFRYRTNDAVPQDTITLVLDIKKADGTWQTSVLDCPETIGAWSPQALWISAWDIGSYGSPFQIRFSFDGMGLTDSIDFDYITMQYLNYTIVENSASVNYNSVATIRANVTSILDPASTLLDFELQYDYDNDWTNGIAGTVANTSKADTENTFQIPAASVRWIQPDGTIYYRIHQWTVAGQHYFSTNESLSTNFQVLDNDSPNCKFVSQNATISYHQWMQVIYNITDQQYASGFDFAGGSVFLYYKIGSAPTYNLDGVAVRYNTSLNPGIIVGVTQVNYANFTISPSSYAYGDTVWHWVVVEDQAVNYNDTYVYAQSFFVDDTVTPTQFSAAGNVVNVSFQLDKLVTFTVLDPAGGSGISPGSVHCYWDDNNGFSSPTEATQQGPPIGNDYTYIIPKETAHYGRLDQTVYFRINASDNEENAILTGNVYSYQVTDSQAPQNVTLWQNFTSNPNYAGESVLWRMTVNDPDVVPSTCSKLSSAFLYVRNESGAPIFSLRNNSAQYNVIIPSNISVSGLLAATIQFEVNETVLSARQEMYYLFQVNDSRYGVFNYTGNFHVGDSIAPSVSFDRARNTTDGTIINYNEDAVFWYYATEPVDAAGFADSIRPMTVIYYKVANNYALEPISALDYTGSTVIYNDPFSSYTGGWFEFRVPNATFAYNDYVWAWVDITDTQYNFNNTFKLGQVPWVRINDTIAPTLGWGVGHNDNPNSYHVSKPTQIIPTEPTDASGIAAIRLFWRRNAVVDGYTGYLDINNFTRFGGITLYVDIPADNFYYLDTIHYVFQITDVVGNKYNTTDRSFSIIDTKAPEYISFPLNNEFFWLMPGKSKNFTFTLSDPNYGVLSPHKSSGTQRIEFYYRLYGIDQGFLLNGTVLLSQNGGTVTFQIPYNATFAGSEDLFYKIRVYDTYGTVNESIGQIKIATNVITTVASPKALPWTYGIRYYHNSLDITFQFVFEGTLGSTPYRVSSAVWFKFDDGAVEGPFTPGGDLSIIITRAFAEGHHNITVWHYNDTLLGFLEFKIDVTPPAKPGSVTAELTDAGVQLTWTAISDEDPQVYYLVYRGLFEDFDINQGEGVLIRRDILTTSVLDDDALMDMTTYYYKVYAVDAAGNLSEVAAVVSFQKPFPLWMWIVIAGIAIGVVVGIVAVTRSRSERKLLMAAMEKSEKAAPVSKEEDWTKVAAAARKRQESAPVEAKESTAKAPSDGKKWATIQTTAVAKPTTAQPVPAGRGGYWKGELQELLTKVVQAEEAGNYAEELRVLEITQRIAQQMQDQETLTMAQQKIKDIWAKLNAQN